MFPIIPITASQIGECDPHSLIFITVGEWKVEEELNVALIVHSKKLHGSRPDIKDNAERRNVLFQNGISKGELTEDIVKSTALKVYL